MKVDHQKQVEIFKDFFDVNYKKEIHKSIQEGKEFLLVNFSDLSQYDFELSEQLMEEPEDTLKSAEVALEQFDILRKKRMRIRFFNLPISQEILIRNIRSIHLGKLMMLSGIVRQASDVRPQVTNAKFECPACGNLISILQIEQAFREPQRCSCGRRGRFRLVGKDLVDAQRLIIEETPEKLEGGEQPKRMSIFLKGDLVEPKMEKRTTPGSKIRVTGIVKEVPIQLKTGSQSTRYELMVDANYIESLQETYEEVVINEEDEKKILELSQDPKIYEKLVSTIAPSIYGHEDVKLALVLQLMGGVRKERKDGTRTRGDVHILLCGDPGSGKSEMLKFISVAAPKARYISGKGSTSAGLTASVVKDEFLRGWALEAGALVLANGGIAVLDELDKLGEDDASAMHEAMEQGSISIAKANIQATLRAVTSVLAAANPKLGRFDPYQPIAAQINMPATLINRFDLIFPIRDLPTRERDDKIASHMLQIQKEPEVLKHEIPLDLFKKYIAYARQRVNPRLTDSALKEIKDFYVNLRNMEIVGESGIKPIPITARQLEALVRLSEGSARIKLSKQVTKVDAKRAIGILKHCLMSVGFDYETQTFDIDRISTGISASQRNKIIFIREIIDQFTSRGMKTISVDEIISEAAEKNITEIQVDEVIDRLKREGYIFEPRKNFVSKV